MLCLIQDSVKILSWPLAKSRITLTNFACTFDSKMALMFLCPMLIFIHFVHELRASYPWQNSKLNELIICILPHSNYSSFLYGLAFKVRQKWNGNHVPSLWISPTLSVCVSSFCRPSPPPLSLSLSLSPLLSLSISLSLFLSPFLSLSLSLSLSFWLNHILHTHSLSLSHHTHSQSPFNPGVRTITLVTSPQSAASRADVTPGDPETCDVLSPPVSATAGQDQLEGDVTSAPLGSSRVN